MLMAKFADNPDIFYRFIRWLQGGREKHHTLIEHEYKTICLRYQSIYLRNLSINYVIVIFNFDNLSENFV